MKIKLINKTLLYLLLISFPLLLTAGFFSYYLVKNEVQESTDETLAKEVYNTRQLISKQAPKDLLFISTDSLSRVESVYRSQPTEFKDTSMFDPLEEEIVTYRIMRTTITLNSRNYLVTVMKPTIEEEDLLEGLFASFAVLLLFLVLSFFVASWLLSKVLWKPFYKTLGQLNAFDSRKHMEVFFEHTGTKEFAQLNEALERMSRKVYEDYLHQKEFTENSSHEMQTPLAVIKANIGLLMQSPNLRSEEMSQLEAIENTVKRLTSLNKALLLLTKIDNNQFTELEDISLMNLLKKLIEELDAFVAVKNLELTMDLETDIHMRMNPTLAEILLSNLLQNAIRHTPENGSISIALKDREFSIRNSGDRLSISPEELFVRFRKNDASKESLGLGLAIVKSISDLYHLHIGYSYADKQHQFSIHFPTT